MYKIARILFKTYQNVELTSQKIKTKFDNLMKFSENFTYGGNKRSPKKFLVNFVGYLWKCGVKWVIILQEFKEISWNILNKVKQL